jgi:PD-(D/E)XK nuclease superfamily
MTETAEPFRISNSKANTWRRCPKAFEFKYIYKIRPKRIKLPLKQGDWMHQLLMVHYDGHDWRERQEVLVADFNKLFDEEKEEYGDLPANTERMMKAYLAHYKEEDARYTTIDSEVDELVPLPDGTLFNLIIDRIVEEPDGGLWIWDHKFVGRFMPPDFMLIDTQLARYFWGARKLGYKNLRGVLFNEVITKPPTLPKELKSGGLEQRKNAWCDAYTYYAELKRRGLDPGPYKKHLMFLKARHKEWFRRQRLPRDAPMTRQVMRELLQTVYEIKDATGREAFPRTPRKECQWDCDYLEPCIIQLQGGDISDVIRHKFEISKRETEDKTKGWVKR